MIRHAAEIWAVLAACFILGALCGSLAYRAIALTSARQGQASLVHGIDGVLRALGRTLMPWRVTVPATLPQTVPVPPPDFRHVVEVPEVHAPEEPDRHWEVAAGPLPVTLAPLPHPAPGEPLLASPPGTGEPPGPDHAPGFQPLALSAPRNDMPDPLHVIVGLTKRHAARLGKVGIFHFSQIASWTPQETDWIANYLGVGTAITDKDWVGQAMQFATSDVPLPVETPKRPRKPKSAQPAASRSRAKAPASDTVPEATTEGDELPPPPKRKRAAQAGTPRPRKKKAAAVPQASDVPDSSSVEDPVVPEADGAAVREPSET